MERRVIIRMTDSPTPESSGLGGGRAGDGDGAGDRAEAGDMTRKRARRSQRRVRRGERKRRNDGGVAARMNEEETTG